MTLLAYYIKYKSYFQDVKIIFLKFTNLKQNSLVKSIDITVS